LRPLWHGLPLLCGFGRLSSSSSLETDRTIGPARLRGSPNSSSSSAPLLSPLLSNAASAAAPICAADSLRMGSASPAVALATRRALLAAWPR